MSGILAVSSIMAVKAQDVKFGIKGGLNISKLTNSDSKTRASFNAGGLVNIALTKEWAIQPELLYSAQGQKYNSALWGFVPSSTLALGYINIPVMVQYSIVPSFYVEAGPQLGFLAGAKLKANGNSTDVKDSFKTADFGLNIGLGYKFDMGIGISGRYNFGLTNVYDVKRNNPGSKNSVAQIDLFYMF